MAIPSATSAPTTAIPESENPSIDPVESTTPPAALPPTPAPAAPAAAPAPAPLPAAPATAATDDKIQNNNGFHFGVSAEYQLDKSGAGWIEAGKDSPSSNDHQTNGFGLNGQIGYDAPISHAENPTTLDLTVGAGYNWGSNAIDAFKPLTVDMKNEALFLYMNRSETGSRNFELNPSLRLGKMFSPNVEGLLGVKGSYRLYSKTGDHSAVTTWSDPFATTTIETQGLVQRTTAWGVGPEASLRLYAPLGITPEFTASVMAGKSGALDNDSVAAGKPDTFNLHGTSLVANVGVTLSLFPKRINNDWDDDGLLNTDEKDYKTDPRNPDSDGDGLSDGDEVHKHFTTPSEPDSDFDGLDDKEEIDGLTKAENGPVRAFTPTLPMNPDSDDDGLQDGDEVKVYETKPWVKDTDEDGLDDGPEVNMYSTSPTDPDSEEDGVPDGLEIEQSAAKNYDTDGDGIKNPMDTDDDGDGIDSLREYKTDGDKYGTDVDEDGILNNVDDDSDGDGKTDKEEGVTPDLKSGIPAYLYGTTSITERRIFTNKEVQFDDGKHDIKPESFPLLDRVAETILKDINNPSNKFGRITRIEIQGHASATGSESSNKSLSDRRAASVKNYLATKGVPAEVLFSTGYGEAVPFVDASGIIYDSKPIGNAKGGKYGPTNTSTVTLGEIDALCRRVEFHITREQVVEIPTNETQPLPAPGR